MGNSNATPSSSASVSLADFVNSAPATSNSTSSTGFDASKMSGKPCTKKQAFAVACRVKDSFFKDVFSSDPRESIDKNGNSMSPARKKTFEYRIIQRIARILLDDKKFDSDSCQVYFKDNSKSLPKPILKKITKAFKDHNQNKDRIDEFLLAVDTKV